MSASAQISVTACTRKLRNSLGKCKLSMSSTVCASCSWSVATYNLLSSHPHKKHRHMHAHSHSNVETWDETPWFTHCYCYMCSYSHMCAGVTIDIHCIDSSYLELGKQLTWVSLASMGSKGGIELLCVSWWSSPGCSRPPVSRGSNSAWRSHSETEIHWIDNII